MAGRAVLFDVDGTLVDVLANQKRVWHSWAARHELDADWVYSFARGATPLDTFAAVAPGLDPAACLATLDELEDEDARSGNYHAFVGASSYFTTYPGTAGQS